MKDHNLLCCTNTHFTLPTSATYFSSERKGPTWHSFSDMFWKTGSGRLVSCSRPSSSASWVAQERLRGQCKHIWSQATMSTFRFKQIHPRRGTRRAEASGRCWCRQLFAFLLWAISSAAGFVVKGSFQLWVSHKETTPKHRLRAVKWLTGQRKTRGDSNSYCVFAYLFC